MIVSKNDHENIEEPEDIESVERVMSIDYKHI